MSTTKSTTKQSKPRGAAVVTLPSDHDLEVARWFDAPPELMWAAFTDAARLRDWYPMPGTSMPVCELDVRVGGAYRLVIAAPNGDRTAFSGTYREVVPGKRLVQAERFENLGVQYVVTTTFEARDGGTLLVNRWTHSSKEARDGQLSFGGWDDAYGRLEALLARK